MSPEILMNMFDDHVGISLGCPSVTTLARNMWHPSEVTWLSLAGLASPVEALKHSGGVGGKPPWLVDGGPPI